METIILYFEDSQSNNFTRTNNSILLLSQIDIYILAYTCAKNLKYSHFW